MRAISLHMYLDTCRLKFSHPTRFTTHAADPLGYAIGHQRPRALLIIQYIFQTAEPQSLRVVVKNC